MAVHLCAVVLIIWDMFLALFLVSYADNINAGILQSMKIQTGEKCQAQTT